MTPRRAAAWTLVGALAVAWLASAAGVIRQPGRTSRVRARSSAGAPPQPITFDVEAQAKRLRRRLAAAPSPQPVRNPFVFASRPEPRTLRVVPEVAPPPVVVAAPVEIEPPLALIGVAEDGAGAALVRTAMIAGEGDELFLVRVGQRVGSYTVSAIGADAVELRDESTNRIRRLQLR